MFTTLEQWLAAEAFGAFLVFSRVGTAIALMPGFGEAYVSVRIRLLMAGVITLAMSPVLTPLLPAIPATPAGLFVLLGQEITIGIFIGTVTRLTLNALQTAGAVIGMQTSLSAAYAFDPSTAQQGALLASFLGALALVIIFVADFHHIMLRAVADSYTLFPPGDMVPIGDFAQVLVQLVSSSFLLGIRISAPFLVFGLVFFLGLGLLARLMPQMQVFFVSQPLQILLGLLILFGTLAAAATAFFGGFEETMSILIAPPR